MQKEKEPAELVVRPMRADEAAAVVAVHLESFPGFFLTFLGADFLRLLYESISNDTQGVVLVVASGQTIQGFVAGVTQQRGFYRRLVNQKKWRFAKASIKALLKRPAIAARLIRALHRPADSNNSSAEACLMSIAVRPAAQGRGIGKLLVEAFCQEMARREVSCVCLTTDRDDNEATNRFYQSLTFNLSRTLVTPEGRVLNEYLLKLK